MNVKNSFRTTLILIFSSTLLFSACKVRDSKIEADVNAKMQSLPGAEGVYTSVKDGVVTLSGDVDDETEKLSVETAIRDIKGVKSVVNNISITPPMPDPMAPVTMSGDELLNQGITDVLKDFPSLKATVQDGVITVTGTATADDWKRVKMALDALRPKKVDATGITIK